MSLQPIEQQFKNLTPDQVFTLTNFNFKRSYNPNLISDVALTFIRSCLFLMNLYIQIWSLQMLALPDNFLYMTRWGLHMVSLSLALCLVSSFINTPEKYVSFLKCGAVITEIAFASQVCIVGVYWTLLHEEVVAGIEEMRRDNPDEWVDSYRQLNILIHIVPAAIAFANVFCSQIVLCFEHIHFMVVYGVCYTVVNFVGTHVKGKPIYGFLTWQDFTSVIIASVILVVNVLIYYLSC